MLHLTVLLGYGVAIAALVVSIRVVRDSTGGVTPAVVGVLIGLATSLLHGAHLWQSVVLPEGWLLTLPNVISLFGWELGLLAVVSAAQRELRTLAIPLFALAAAGSLFTSVGAAELVRSAPELGIKAHAVLSLLAYGLLAASALLGIFVLYQDRRLRVAKVSGWTSTLPPLFATERLLFGVLGGGWILLTLALATGVVFLEDMFAQHLAHKSVLSLLGWVILTVLIAGHLRWGWRGRRAVHWLLGTFVLLMIAYFGSKAVLEQLLGRAWG